MDTITLPKKLVDDIMDHFDDVISYLPPNLYPYYRALHLCFYQDIYNHLSPEQQLKENQLLENI